jgi:hypothetical protein
LDELNGICDSLANLKVGGCLYVSALLGLAEVRAIINEWGPA